MLATTLAGVAIGAAVFLLVGRSPARAITNPAFPQLALALQVSADEEVVFFQQCSPCHGVGGEGGIGPSLITSTLSAEARLQLIRSGLNAMPAFETTLDDATITALSRLASRLAATTTYVQQCAPCHGPSGEGGIGPALVGEDGSFDEIRLIISDGEGAMPAFRPTLTDDQLEGVTLFVEHLAVVEAGSELYAGLCTGCHGASGEGGIGPALTGSDIGAGEITIAVSTGVGSMPGFSSSLSETELAAVLAYTRNLVAGLVAPAPSANTGEALYGQLCASCHGVEGEGGAGPSLLEHPHTDEELSAVISEGRGGMPGFGAEVSTEDLAALVAFVQTSFGEPASTAGGEELYAELCLACHGTDGGGGVGPSLGGLALTSDQLTTLINEGKGSMPGFAAQINAEAVAQLIDFLVERFGGPVETTTTTTVPARSGAELYAADCARCHLADGSGDQGPD
ncbi:MAG: c-type cytochrome, partial [Acidimicrobiia bacterium]|nr:c-type cytochrome [Acidimicrobiia bacterium]